MSAQPVACPLSRSRRLPLPAVGLVLALTPALGPGCADYPFGPPRLEPTRTDALDDPPMLSPPPCQVGPPPQSFVGRDGPMLVLDGERFRAVGANQSIAGPLVAMNTIVAESLDWCATRLEQATGVRRETVSGI